MKSFELSLKADFESLKPVFRACFRTANSESLQRPLQLAVRSEGQPAFRGPIELCSSTPLKSRGLCHVAKYIPTFQSASDLIVFSLSLRLSAFTFEIRQFVFLFLSAHTDSWRRAAQDSLLSIIMNRTDNGMLSNIFPAASLRRQYHFHVLRHFLITTSFLCLLSF